LEGSSCDREQERLEFDKDSEGKEIR
jgi:hypothetical protein